MLINLTNHPFSQWSDKQRNEALRMFGEITDIPFPRIFPEAGTGEIVYVVDEYVEKILKLGMQNTSITVHIMGEHTFCYNLIRKLLAKGIPCVASTSQRMVEETASHEKMVRFDFVRFREYV